MKFISKVSVFVFLAVFTAAASAMAVPSNLFDITGIDGTQQYTDTGAEGFTLSDADGNNDDATAFLLLELAGFKDTNTFGIYGYTTDNEGNVIKGSSLEIFDGTHEAIYGEDGKLQNLDSVTLDFDLVNNTVTNAKTNEWIGLDPVQFGFYMTTTEGIGHTYYTHNFLNSEDNYDHAKVFDTHNNDVGELAGSDVVIAFEDLLGGGDRDHTDMVVGISDITPVPEPATLVLMGLGLFGLAGFGRRKYKK